MNESVDFSSAGSYDNDTENDPEVADDTTTAAWQYSSDDGSTWTGFGSGDAQTKAWTDPGKYIVRAIVNDVPLEDCADDVGPLGSPFEGAYESNQLVVYVVRVKIKDGDTDVTDQTRNWVVGKPASLTAEVLPDNLTGVTYLWSIPEKTVKSYNVSDDAASTTSLSASDLAQKDVSFHWVDGADGRHVVFTVTVPAANNKTFSATTTFNVKCPTNVTMTAQTGDVNVYSYGSAGVIIYEGEGMEFAGSCTQPTGFSGTLNWIQVITGGRRRCYNGTTHQWKYAEMYGCDLGTDGTGHYVYAVGNSAVDSPQQGLGLPYTVFQIVNQSFTMWLMYQPSGGVLVPLRKMDWWWSGATSYDGNQWVKTSGNHVQNPASSATTDYPTWTTNNVNTYVWIPE